MEKVEPVLNAIKKVSDASIIHCQGCNAPIKFINSGVKECEYCGKLTEFRVKKVETQKIQVEDKYKGNEYSSKYKDNYKKPNKVNEYATYQSQKELNKAISKIGSVIGGILGILTALLMLPFMVANNWTSINRTSRRRRRRW